MEAGDARPMSPVDAKALRLPETSMPQFFDDLVAELGFDPFDADRPDHLVVPPPVVPDVVEIATYTSSTAAAPDPLDLVPSEPVSPVAEPVALVVEPVAEGVMDAPVVEPVQALIDEDVEALVTPESQIDVVAEAVLDVEFSPEASEEPVVADVAVTEPDVEFVMEPVAEARVGGLPRSAPVQVDPVVDEAPQVPVEAPVEPVVDYYVAAPMMPPRERGADEPGAV